ncbi:MAG: hypothetical protein IJ695_09190 [Butyrivibrio sp.]|nr:hypothetical protein [Butyrivibrio sp.]
MTSERKIHLPYSLTTTGCFSEKILELLLNSLSDNDLKTILGQVHLGHLSIVCQGSDNVRFILEHLSSNIRGMMENHISSMGLYTHTEIANSCDRLLASILLIMKKDGITLQDSPALNAVIDEFTPSIEESEIRSRQWDARQVNAAVKEFCEVMGAPLPDAISEEIEEKDELYASGCIEVQEVDPDFECTFDYNDIKVGLESADPGYLRIKLVSFFYKNLDPLILDVINNEAGLVALTAITPKLSPDVKEILFSRLSPEAAAAIEERISSGNTGDHVIGANSVLMAIGKAEQDRQLFTGALGSIIHLFLGTATCDYALSVAKARLNIIQTI